MANEQFSLCWDNFHSNMSNGLTSLLKTEDLVDVTLAAEGRYLKAHKMVLSVCSPYFRELFQVNPCKHPIVFLKDVSFNALNNLLEFMYQGEVKVSQEDLGTFIKTAEALKIKGLTGDGPTQNDTASEPTPTQNNVTSSEPGPPTRKIAREKSPPVRKKMLGPASKRFKADADTPPPLVTIQQQQPQIQPQTAIQISSVKEQTVEEQIVQFKLEPEETAVSLTNDEDETYDDSAMDDMGIDNSTDYMMENTSEVEVRDVKAGTSTAVDNADATGDNQDELLFSIAAAFEKSGITSRTRKIKFSPQQSANESTIQIWHKGRLRGMTRLVESINAEQHVQNSFPPENLTVTLPVNTLIDFYEFETYLQDKENFKKMVLYLRPQVSSHIRQSICNILRAILNDEVAVLFNYFGKPPKTRFNNTNMNKLTFCATTCVNAASFYEYKDHVMTYLKYAKQRLKQTYRF